MIGIVEVFYGDNKVDEGSNMILDNLGEVITQFMTLPRALEHIPTASSLLDTSNYSVRAASLGKDALGYQYHAHTSALFGAITQDGILRVISYDDVTTSSYATSSFYVSTGLKLLPESSKPTMSRLEEGSTQIWYLSGSLDMGHNLNLIPSGGVSASLGCYAPSGNFIVHVLSARVDPLQPLTDNLIVSALFTNTSGFNCYKSIDSRGFITMQSSSIIQGRAFENASVYPGLIVSYPNGWDTTGNLEIKYILNVDSKDFVCLNIFGGIYNIGLWCYDVEAMLAKGMYPPFTSYDKDELEYKLVARKTFTRDLTSYKDYGAPGITAVEDLKLVWTWRFK